MKRNNGIRIPELILWVGITTKAFCAVNNSSFFDRGNVYWVSAPVTELMEVN